MLTYMSTDLHRLVRDGLIRQVSGDLGPGQVPNRLLCVTKEFEKWAFSLPENLVTKRLLRPRVELEAIFAEFIAGSKVVSSLNWIMPAKHGCIALQTPSLRMAGWVPAPQTLVLADGALVDEAHGSGLKTKPVLAESVKNQRASFGVSTWCRGEKHELFRPAN